MVVGSFRFQKYQVLVGLKSVVCVVQTGQWCSASSVQSRSKHQNKGHAKLKVKGWHNKSFKRSRWRGPLNSSVRRHRKTWVNSSIILTLQRKRMSRVISCQMFALTAANHSKSQLVTSVACVRSVEFHLLLSVANFLLQDPLRLSSGEK